MAHMNFVVFEAHTGTSFCFSSAMRREWGMTQPIIMNKYRYPAPPLLEYIPLFHSFQSIIACFWQVIRHLRRNMRGIFSDKPSYSLQNTGKLLSKKTLEPALRQPPGRLRLSRWLLVRATLRSENWAKLKMTSVT